MGTYIAVDIGGTKLRVAVYPENSIEPLHQKWIPTQGNGTALDRLKDLIADLWPKDDEVLAIGAAAPGPLNPKAGILYNAPNIPGWVNLPLRQMLENRFGVPVALGNDANMAALGECRFGAGIGHGNLIYITISTGIGGGVMMDDRLVLGARGLAGELGHVTIVEDGPVCSCGKRGHLEAVASGTAIARYTAKQMEAGRKSSLNQLGAAVTAKDVALAAAGGDELAIEAMKRAGTFMGVALANYLHIFNPTMIILGGGVSRSGPVFMEPMRATMEANVISPEYLVGLEIKLAALGDNAGLLGSLELARMMHVERSLDAQHAERQPVDDIGMPNVH